MLDRALLEDMRLGRAHAITVWVAITLLAFAGDTIAGLAALAVGLNALSFTGVLWLVCATIPLTLAVPCAYVGF